MSHLRSDGYGSFHPQPMAAALWAIVVVITGTSTAYAQPDFGGSVPPEVREWRELRTKALNSASLSDEQFCEFFKACLFAADTNNRKFYIMPLLKAELAARCQRYSIVERNALMQRLHETALSVGEERRTVFISSVASGLPPGLAMPFLSPLLLEGDSWDDKASFVFMVYICQVKNPGEDVAEALYQLFREVEQAILAGTIPDHCRTLLEKIPVALDRCGEAGFERLQRLHRRGWSDPAVLKAMIRTGAAAAVDLVLRYYEQAQSYIQWSDSPQAQGRMEAQQLSALEALCHRPVRDYPADIQKFIHAEITRFLGSEEWEARYAAAGMALMTEDEAYLPRLEELAQNDPFSDEVSTGFGREEKVVYPVREAAERAIEELRKRCDRGKLKSSILRDVEQIKVQIESCERSAKLTHIPPEHLPEYLARFTETKRALEAELERHERQLTAADTLDKASVPREWLKYQIEHLEKDVNQSRASLAHTGPHYKADFEAGIAASEKELQTLREELSRLPAP